MRTFCQLLIVVQLFSAFLLMVYQDFNGKKAKDPAGYGGFIGTLIVTSILASIYYGAGAFDYLLGYSQ